ncbi:hypothetical protein EDI_037410 [Entamoeba dispar SAW760]|uniref:Uncharacterized protein n=1 Tax=Entamoeba dispar (strain ATCC PRA-260 / SAW760) TaxID=370354 RepID=B0EAS7_ENTDS|nr:uncharacterized protein EDI_037410 [Entamoeba dispar SAW760]EDR28366.1 hypothetical protein EDI_037410 [Entamoeba dispar SAW760]|eukprot:EDR28366.1 hypothetical protein EDI_037410 [Entamoeba dispar SAW760]
MINQYYVNTCQVIYDSTHDKLSLNFLILKFIVTKLCSLIQLKKDEVGMVLCLSRETNFIFTCHRINNSYNVDPSFKNPLIHYKMQKFLIHTLIIFELK